MNATTLFGEDINHLYQSLQNQQSARPFAIGAYHLKITKDNNISKVVVEKGLPSDHPGWYLSISKAYLAEMTRESFIRAIELLMLEKTNYFANKNMTFLYQISFVRSEHE